MSAFLICDVTVKDREKLGEYLKLSEHTLAPFGGKFHVQAGALEIIEGGWNPKVIIIAEFPSMEKAREWYKSPDYAKALNVKPQAMDRNMILVEGLA
ncbi:MAG: DUF1330 domain-containing protein [Anaerolineae bacterium]